MKNPLEKLRELDCLIGNTPMAEITFRLDGRVRRVFAKLEHYNYSGSIKDRIALHCIRRAYETGQLKPGDTLAETTSGNTGISFCAVGTYLGHPCNIFMPDWMSAERKSMMVGFGAQLTLLSREEGGFLGCLEKTARLGQQAGVWLPDQFANPYNTETHYLTTGPEIAAQMDALGADIHGFTAGVGTGGTVMGVGRYLREKARGVKVFPMEPESSPTLSTGHQVGRHRIAGISDEFIPAIVKLDQLDDIIMVDDGDAIVMAQRVSRELGLGIGISAGANFLAAIKGADLIGPGANVVTVFADDNKKYLSTDYAKQEPLKDSFISTKIQFLDFRTVK